MGNLHQSDEEIFFKQLGNDDENKNYAEAARAILEFAYESESLTVKWRQDSQLSAFTVITEMPSGYTLFSVDACSYRKQNKGNKWGANGVEIRFSPPFNHGSQGKQLLEKIEQLVSKSNIDDNLRTVLFKKIVKIRTHQELKTHLILGQTEKSEQPKRPNIPLRVFETQEILEDFFEIIEWMVTEITIFENSKFVY